MSADWQTAGWPVARIRDIGRLHGGGTPSRKRPEFFQGSIPWITGQDIPENYVAEITSARDYVTEEAVQESATRIVPAGAVLITTRVSVGKTAIAGCPICFSQDVTAILIHSAAVALPAYVAQFLRSRRDALLQKNQGSTIAGITRDSLALEQIPLPPVSEQHRIVEILQAAETIRRLRAEAETKTAELIPAIFSTTFGDLYFAKSRFPVRALSSIGDLDRGKSKHRPRDEPSLYGGPYPFVQTGDVAQANGWITSFSQTYSEKGLAQSRLWRAGTLAITIAANIGATAILTFDACFPDSVVGFTPNDGISVEYVRWWLLGYQRKLEIQAPQGAQKNINLEVLRSIQIPVPPEEIQSKFKAAIHNLREQLYLAAAGAKSLAALSASLSAHAFSGQLTADWREKHRVTLAGEVRTRDAELAILSGRPVIVNFSTADARVEAEAFNVPDELNREQKALLTLSKIRQLKRATERKRGTVDYFTAELLAAELDGPLRRNPHAIEAHLAVFAARGLIIPVSREEQTEDTGEYVFGNAYRLPIGDQESLAADEQSYRATVGAGEKAISERIPGDFSRLREMERLVVQLEKERMLT
ncbi:MAG: restriction endonuclease subunit S [Chthoniobacterales bacterium]